MWVPGKQNKWIIEWEWAESLEICSPCIYRPFLRYLMNFLFICNRRERKAVICFVEFLLCQSTPHRQEQKKSASNSQGVDKTFSCLIRCLLQSNNTIRQWDEYDEWMSDIRYISASSCLSLLLMHQNNNLSSSCKLYIKTFPLVNTSVAQVDEERQTRQV